MSQVRGGDYSRPCAIWLHTATRPEIARVASGHPSHSSASASGEGIGVGGTIDGNYDLFEPGRRLLRNRLTAEVFLLGVPPSYHRPISGGPTKIAGVRHD